VDPGQAKQIGASLKDGFIHYAGRGHVHAGSRLFNNASSVVTGYQEGKKGDGENNEKQAGQAGKPGIRDESAADNPRNYGEPGRGIEDGLG
jgi:hypothetical protein